MLEVDLTFSVAESGHVSFPEDLQVEEGVAIWSIH